MRNPTELQRLLLHNAAFTPPLRIVADVPLTVRTERPLGAPHSVAEELWHIVYWQDRFVRWLRKEDVNYPAHAEEGWLKIDVLDDTAWNDLVSRFEAGLTTAGEAAAEGDLTTRYSTLVEPLSGAGPLNLLDLLTNVAVHNAYHLGRIVQLRQILNCWPPPGGGDTW